MNKQERRKAAQAEEARRKDMQGHTPQPNPTDPTELERQAQIEAGRQMAAEEPKTEGETKAKAEEPKTEGETKAKAEEPKTEGETKAKAEEPKTEGETKAKAEEPKTEGETKAKAEEKKPETKPSPSQVSAGLHSLAGVKSPTDKVDDELERRLAEKREKKSPAPLSKENVHESVERAGRGMHAARDRATPEARRGEEPQPPRQPEQGRTEGRSGESRGSNDRDNRTDREDRTPPAGRPVPEETRRSPTEEPDEFDRALAVVDRTKDEAARKLRALQKRGIAIPGIHITNEEESDMNKDQGRGRESDRGSRDNRDQGRGRESDRGSRDRDSDRKVSMMVVLCREIRAAERAWGDNDGYFHQKEFEENWRGKDRSFPNDPDDRSDIINKAEKAGLIEFDGEDLRLTDKGIEETKKSSTIFTKNEVDDLLVEIDQAEEEFKGRFVGVNWFIKNWKTRNRKFPGLDDDGIRERRDRVGQAESEDLVEIYEENDRGEVVKAIRLTEAGQRRLPRRR